MKNRNRLLVLLTVGLTAGLVSAGKPEPSEISVRCGGTTFAPGASASCPLGETFWLTGTDFPHNVDVTITKSGSQTPWYFDDKQTTTRGELQVPLSSGFGDAGTYQADVSANRGKLHRLVTIALQ